MQRVKCVPSNRGYSLTRAYRPSRQRRNGQSGATLVEYAFIFMIFLALLFGIGGFGHALFVYHFLNEAAKEATRYAAVRGSTCYSGDKSCVVSNSASGVQGPTTSADILAYVQSLTPQSVDSSKVVVPTTGALTLCGVQGLSSCADSIPTDCPTTPNKPGCTVAVTVAYSYNFIFPLLPSSSTTTYPCTTAGICLSSTSEMVIAH
jgi:Flp pilus assembly protein TadG